MDHPWVLDRLAKANAKRRDFFRYAREHKQRLSSNSHTVESKEQTEKRLERADQARQHDTAPTRSTAFTFEQSRMQTTATTAIAQPVPIDDGLDVKDASTVASTVCFRQSENALTIPPLTDFGKVSVPFDCPYCAKPQEFNGQSGWR